MRAILPIKPRDNSSPPHLNPKLVKNFGQSVRAVKAWKQANVKEIRNVQLHLL